MRSGPPSFPHSNVLSKQTGNSVGQPAQASARANQMRPCRIAASTIRNAQWRRSPQHTPLATGQQPTPASPRTQHVAGGAHANTADELRLGQTTSPGCSARATTKATTRPTKLHIQSIIDTLKAQYCCLRGMRIYTPERRPAPWASGGADDVVNIRRSPSSGSAAALVPGACGFGHSFSGASHSTVGQTARSQGS